jgi:MYXO-CTERM domain-containing protein
VLRLRSTLVLGALLLLSSTDAFAQSASPTGPTGATGGKDELSNLERNLASESAALSTADCTTACRALASIRRAADKICALEPGDRCAAGRAKADEATKRVRDACPECAIATAPPKPAPEREERAMTKGGAQPTADSASPVTAASPPSESKRGGCAGCATTPTSPGDLTTAALAISALAFTLRRRRKPTG